MMERLEEQGGEVARRMLDGDGRPPFLSRGGPAVCATCVDQRAQGPTARSCRRASSSSTRAGSRPRAASRT
jgi:hypothetical protein